MFKRILNAFRTSDVQLSAVLMLTMLNIFAGLTSYRDLKIWHWIIIVGLWPSFAFISNLIRPISKD